MKHITIILLLLVSSFNLLAQTPQISWGPTFKQNKNITSHIAGVTDKGFYTYNKTYYQMMPLKIVDKSIQIQRFNKDMVQTKDGEISLRYKKENRSFERFLLLDGRLFMFTSYQEKKKRKQILLVEQIDLNNLTSKGDPMEIGSMPVAEKNRLGEFQIAISQDSSKVLAYANYRGSEGARERFSCTVFDNRMQELWNIEEELPFEDKRFSMDEVKLSNQGEVMISAVKLELEKKTLFGERTRQSEIHLLLYLKQGTERQQYVLDLEDRNLEDIQFELSPKGQLICGGLFGEADARGVDGTFLIRYDTKSEELISETYSPFDRSILVEMVGEKGADDEVSPTTYVLDRMIMKGDGGVVLVAESYYTRTVSSYSNGQWTYRTYFYYNDILVASLDPEGETEWYELIEKRQVSSGITTFSSYKLMVLPDRLCFIYNDSRKNAGTDNDKIYNFSGGKNAVVSMVNIGLDGRQEKEFLINSKDEGVFFIPFLSFQYNSQEMLLRAEKRNKSRYARLTF